MKEIFIVGGGPSLKDYDFKQLRGKETIAVNKAVFDLEKPTYFITMDYTFIQRYGRWMLQQSRKNLTNIFVANLEKLHLKDDGTMVDLRINLVYNLSFFHITIKSYYAQRMGLKFEDFRHGECSGYCALQFAIIMGYSPIYLLGIDLTCRGVTHYHGGYGEDWKKFNHKLKRYYEYFKFGLKDIKKKQPDIEIYSCSKTSRLNHIVPYKPFEEIA